MTDPTPPPPFRPYHGPEPEGLDVPRFCVHLDGQRRFEERELLAIHGYLSESELPERRSREKFFKPHAPK